MAKTREKPVHVGNAWRVILHDLGLDERTILRRASLPPTLFQGEGSWISVDDFYTLHEVVEQESGDLTIALQAGSTASIELFDPALFAAICSPDMNTAARRLSRFKRLVGVFRLDVDASADETTLCFRCKHRHDLPKIFGSAEIIFLVAFARRATRHHIEPRQVTFQHIPETIAPFADYFGCPILEGDTYTVTFSAQDASRPFLTHNSRMWEAFEPDLQRRMDEANEEIPVSARVETTLYELLPSGRTQLRDVAKELAIGTRTLQRRLAEEETTWLEVLNRTRERLALHYLRASKMSPAEISFLLGFEDPNSLFRAFQRWTGTTPESWRAETQTMV